MNNTISLEYIFDKIIDISTYNQVPDNRLIKEININKEQFKDVPQNKIKCLFQKVLLIDTPSHGIRQLEKLGLLSIFIPELQRCVGFDQSNPHHDYDVFEHILHVLDNTPVDLTLRWAALLHDIAKPTTFFLDNTGKGRFFGHDIKGGEIARKILNRLGYDKKFIGEVALLIEAHMSRYNIMKKKTLIKLVDKVGEKNIEKLFQLQRADIKGRHGPYDFSKVEVMENMLIDLKNKDNIKKL